MAYVFIEPLDCKTPFGVSIKLSFPEPEYQKIPYRFFTRMVIYQPGELLKEDAWQGNKKGLTITEIKGAS